MKNRISNYLLIEEEWEKILKILNPKIRRDKITMPHTQKENAFWTNTMWKIPKITAISTKNLKGRQKYFAKENTPSTLITPNAPAPA